jgi:hypothetical protein
MASSREAESRHDRIRELATNIERCLAPHGFGKGVRDSIVPLGIDTMDWFRRWGWKTDCVSLGYNAIKAEYVSVGISVMVPVDRSNEEHEVLRGQPPSVCAANLFALSRRWSRGYHLRGGVLTCTTPARHVPSDLERALAWFERTSTPKACLAMHDRAAETAASARTRAYVHSYLVSLPPHLDTTVCPLSISGEEPSPSA